MAAVIKVDGRGVCWNTRGNKLAIATNVDHNVFATERDSDILVFDLWICEIKTLGSKTQDEIHMRFVQSLLWFFGLKMYYSREEWKDEGDKRGNEWQIIPAMSILLPTYQKIIPISSYLSTIGSAARSIWNAPLPWAARGPSKVLGRPQGYQDCPLWRKKVLILCILYLCYYVFVQCSYFVFVFAFCNCVFACPP